MGPLDACIELNHKMNKKNRLLQVKLDRLYTKMQNAIGNALRVATEGSEAILREQAAHVRALELRK